MEAEAMTRTWVLNSTDQKGKMLLAIHQVASHANMDQGLLTLTSDVAAQPLADSDWSERNHGEVICSNRHQHNRMACNIQKVTSCLVLLC